MATFPLRKRLNIETQSAGELFLHGIARHLADCAQSKRYIAVWSGDLLLSHLSSEYADLRNLDKGNLAVLTLSKYRRRRSAWQRGAMCRTNGSTCHLTSIGGLTRLPYELDGSVQGVRLIDTNTVIWEGERTALLVEAQVIHLVKKPIGHGRARKLISIERFIEWAFRIEKVQLESDGAPPAASLRGYGREGLVNRGRCSVDAGGPRETHSSSHIDAQTISAAVKGTLDRQVVAMVADDAPVGTRPDYKLGLFSCVIAVDWTESRHGRQFKTEVLPVVPLRFAGKCVTLKLRFFRPPSYPLNNGLRHSACVHELTPRDRRSPQAPYPRVSDERLCPSSDPTLWKFKYAPMQPAE